MSGSGAAKKGRWRSFEHACRQGYCPGLDERANAAVQELANRLKASSDKETLTNILDWQDRNLAFWFERNPLSLAISSTIVVLLITAPFLILNLQILFGYYAVLLSVIATLLLVAVYMVHSYRKLPLKQLLDLFRLNVPVGTILKSRVCVCRDYSKLAACLLLNIYPDREVYFAHATNHVAAAAMVGGKMYVLDKHLPITTIDRWHERWHKGEFSEKTIEKVKGTTLETMSLESFLFESKSVQLDTVKLANEMSKRLGVQTSCEDARAASLKVFQWKKGALLCEDDEIVNYSLTRLLIMKLSSQMLGQHQLVALNIVREEDDLVFQVKFMPNS